MDVVTLCAREVCGGKRAASLPAELPNKIRDVLGILVDDNLCSQDGVDVIEIVTPPYPNPISYKGQYYHRSGSTLQELKGAALGRNLLRHYGHTWDSVPMPGYAIRDLSSAAYARFRALAARNGRLALEALYDSDTGLLEKLKLKDETSLKRAAIILFHDDPSRAFSGAFVKLGYFRSDVDLICHDEIYGDLFSQIHQTLDLLCTKYHKAAITYEHVVRVERFPVTREAMREALLNAPVHRDDAVQAPVQIRVYDDTLVIVNPATLPEGWSVSTLRSPHYSHPYNPDIAHEMFRAGEIETWGSGIHRINSSCHSAGYPEAIIRYEAHALWLEFPFSGAYLDAVRYPNRHHRDGEVTGEVISLQRYAFSTMTFRPKHCRKASADRGVTFMRSTVDQANTNQLYKRRIASSSDSMFAYVRIVQHHL